MTQPGTASPRRSQIFRTTVLKEIGLALSTQLAIGPQQEVIGTNQAVIMQGVDDPGPLSEGQSREIIAQAEVVVKMDDVGAPLSKHPLKLLDQKGVRPVCQPRKLPPINTVKHGKPVGSRSFQPVGMAILHVGDMKDRHVIGLRQAGGQLEAMQFRPLARERRELVIELKNAHAASFGTVLRTVMEHQPDLDRELSW